MKRAVALLSIILCLSLVWAGLVSSHGGFGQTSRARTVKRSQVHKAKLAGRIDLSQEIMITSLTELDGRMYGAGRNMVFALSDKGEVLQRYQTSVARPSISAHAGGMLLLADLDEKSVQALDVKSGELKSVLNLREIKDRTPKAGPTH